MKTAAEPGLGLRLNFPLKPGPVSPSDGIFYGNILFKNDYFTANLCSL